MELTNTCDDACDCGTNETAAATPIVCTLDAAEIPDRLAAWQDLMASSTRDDIADGVRLALSPAVALADVARLVEAERACCSFFSFTLTADEHGAALEIRGPADAVEMLLR